VDDIILLTLTGADRPGLTVGICEILAGYGASVLDIGQAVIHARLNLGVLLELPEAGRQAELEVALQAFAGQHQFSLSLSRVTPGDYDAWVEEQGRARYIVTLLARQVTAEQIARVTAVVADHGLNIEAIDRLSGRVPLGEAPPLSKACVEFSLRGPMSDARGFRADLMRVAGAMEIDLAVQKDTMFRRNRRLVAFDMDSTLIEAEVIDELAAEAGVWDEVRAITQQAMRGELDFAASFRARVALLRGLDASVLSGIAQGLRVTEGADHLLRTLRSLGYRTAILSGGFTFFAHYLQDRLGIDHIYANELDIVDGRVTGEVNGPIIDGARKAELLEELARREGIDMQQVIAVGDGANDLPMLDVAGLGIAFRAKPLVKEAAEQSISTLGLDAILYLLGIADNQYQESAQRHQR